MDRTASEAGRQTSVAPRCAHRQRTDHRRWRQDQHFCHAGASGELLIGLSWTHLLTECHFLPRNTLSSCWSYLLLRNRCSGCH